MKVIGLRAEPGKTRFALVDYDGETFRLLNAQDESRLVYPADVTQAEAKAEWLYREFERLHHAHPDIVRACLKINEYTQSDTKAKRETAYAEGVILLFFKQKNIPVDAKIYASLSTNSGSVRQHAEQRVGRTERYWDAKMADAIIAAWWSARQ
jgi:hypothetical protein